MQVIQDPNFRNSRAAGELKKQMKLVMDLYNEMVAEIESPGKGESECDSFSGESMLGKHSLDKHEDGKLTDLLESKQPLEKFAEKEPLPFSSPLTQLDDSHIRGSYMVGGSAFGWNFITFSGSKPVYYGLTKEAYRKTL
uniref:Uncharacterized protein MANES_06G148200 n=1 Tax=Rhizophora mucronata TaxID=61149 RepID=A0A2P2IST4_RHIMU